MGRERSSSRISHFPSHKREQQIIDAILEKVTPTLGCALLDTSSAKPLCHAIGKDHSVRLRNAASDLDRRSRPRMLPLNLRQFGATYYTGNCHKWICAPKTAAFLYVPKEKQRLVRPLIISHGANSPRTDRSRFLIEFSWMGTSDPTPCLTVPEALRFISTLHPKGWPGLMERNRELALEARKLLCQFLQIPLPCPPEMVGSMAAMPLPPCPVDELSTSPLYRDVLQQRLYDEYRIEVPGRPLAQACSRQSLATSPHPHLRPGLQ